MKKPPTTHAITAPEENITAEIMLERAQAMVPRLRERATATEELRTLPVETVNDFIEAGFYRILQPRRFGGYELGLRSFCDVMTQIARGCSSAGWVLCLTSAHTFHMSACAEAGQVEMYGDDGDFRCPLILAPQGTATPVDAGYELNGRWNYNSGGEHSNWVAVSAIVPGAGKDSPPADLLMAFIPREDYEVFDNWHTLGMRGTGSKQAVVESVFVPEHRVISQPAWSAGRAPGYGVHDNPFYQTPHIEVFCAELSAICIGIAEAALDAFIERAESKANPFPPFQRLKHDSATQRYLGLARARVDAASAVLDRILANQDNSCKQVEAGTCEYSRESTLRIMLLVNEVCRLCTEAIDCLFAKSGTSATQSGQVIERVYRDLATIRTHYLMDEERNAQSWGALHFGLAERPMS
ncbi:MAG: acyl-CoA dehydrogenase family protein [Pseudomonadota bacterium]